MNLKQSYTVLLIFFSSLLLSPPHTHACAPLAPGSNGAGSQEWVTRFDIRFSRSATPIQTEYTTQSPGDCKLYTTITTVVSIYYLIPTILIVLGATIYVSRAIAKKRVGKILSVQSPTPRI